MICIIAEKPSVAREIAAIVKAENKKEGYIEGNGYTVTWAFGHLIQLAFPEDYGIPGFRKEHLPIIPENFILKPRQIKQGKEYKEDTGAAKQLKTINNLFTQAERIIVATDAGREGELIFRYIYEYLKCKTPFDRLWISSLTEKAIREGLNNLKKGSEYDTLFASAQLRSQADWLIGINASQALSIAAGQGVFSLGRVQTPTLSMICDRYQENKKFIPVPYWQIKITSEKDSISFSAQSNDKWENKEQAQNIFEKINQSDQVSVQSVEKKEINQEPPLLYDLTTLQKEANSKHGFTADKTLSIAQKLYESKLITYPRTGSRYVSEDVFDTIKELIQVLCAHSKFGKYAQFIGELNRRSVNDKKVTDHHALLITENSPANLPDEERTIYDMVAGRMLESFSEKCIKDTTTVILDCQSIPFSIKGSVIKQAGWRAVHNDPSETEEEENLPSLNQGESLVVTKPELLEKITKPRPLHTEASLLSGMETAGKELSDEEQRQAIKDCGIGTPATRAAIIETLFTRDYIMREKKSLIPTPKGLSVYNAVKEKRIANVSLTGEWESSLSQVESGTMQPESFRQSITIYTGQITKELLDSFIENSSNQPDIVCPKCNNSKIRIFPKIAKCTDESCGFKLFREVCGKILNDKDILALLTNSQTFLIKGMKGKSGKSFDAHIRLKEDFTTEFIFDNTKKPKKK